MYNKDSWKDNFIKEIILELKFKSNYPLKQKFKEVEYFIRTIQHSLAQNPRNSVKKEKLNLFIKNASKLRSILQDIHPLMIRGVNDIHSKTLPKPIYTYDENKLEIEDLHHVLITIKSLCIFPDWKVARKKSSILKATKQISDLLVTQIETVLNSFGDCKVDMSIKINEYIRENNIVLIANDVISFIDEALEIIIEACKKIYEQLGSDRGRSFDALARNFLIKLAAIYEEGTGIIPTASNKPYYEVDRYEDGTLYRLARMITPLFRPGFCEELEFLEHPSSVGEMAIEAMKYYNQFRNQIVELEI